MTTTPTGQPTPSAPHTPDSGHTTTPDQNNNASDSTKPREAPTPASQTRNNNPPGGVTDPSRAEQDALENSVPRDENGDPTRPPDPADGPWVQRINGEGPDAPGRSNNCVDTALSTVDTYAGNPTAAGARTPDLDADGNPSDRGERGGRDRIENTLGARFSDMGNGRDAFNRLENTLRDSGHGSQAVIITQDANGRAHAWNAVNHNGKITYIDAQTGQQSRNPLHSGDHGVFAVPLDSNRQPITPSTVVPTSRPDSARTADRETSSTSGESNRRPPLDPAGAPEGEPRPHPERESPTERHSQQPPDEKQAELRKTNPVYRVEHDHVDQQMRDWATNGNLAEALRIAAGDTPHPDGEGAYNPRVLTDRQLQDVLPGFEQLNRGERMAVISTLARLSHTFHQEYGVTSNPVQTDGKSRGGELHENRGPDFAKALLAAVSNPSENVGKHTPDLTGRNYAVLETVDSGGNVRYVVDSSEGQGGSHSERSLLNWMEQANKTENKFKVTGLYTEREPCGDRKGALGAQKNCSKLLSDRLAGTPVYYSTTYRAHEAAIDERMRRGNELRREEKKALGVTKLDRATREAIKAEVDELVQSDAEREMEAQFQARVDLAQELWLKIAEQV
ncbi:toxin glutamine deamidase domain-containing protein [Streptomyces sp. JHA19]|uniref:toxin glutamine deamidase domain-containing protein n=1 Tax=Streptomyces sp. JHA19 TaxID=1577588 RepID=UPI00131E1FEB|nr:toxin glutamine deamidase domain-containing protein [Streptomyces sp. JHA19]